jgi:hypothetical protein
MAASQLRAATFSLLNLEAESPSTFLDKGNASPFYISPLRTSSSASTSGSLFTSFRALKNSFTGKRTGEEAGRRGVAAEAVGRRGRKGVISELVAANATTTSVPLTDTQKVRGVYLLSVVKVGGCKASWGGYQKVQEMQSASFGEW